MLLKRVLTSIIGVIYIIIVIRAGGWLFDLTMLFLALSGMYEIYSALVIKGHNPAKLLGYLFIAAYFITSYYDINMIVVVIIGLLAGAIKMLFDESFLPSDLAFTLLGVLYPSMVFMLMIEFNYTIPMYLLVIILICTWSSDTFAYFTGLLFGKNKLCPNISPKKTIEGSIGGLIGSVLSSVIIWVVMTNSLDYNTSIIIFITTGIICGIFSQLGDLIASVLKRYCGIKDYGHILPGHGGILDRFDSVILTVPTVISVFIIMQNII